MTDLIPVTPLPATGDNHDPWRDTLRLVGEWLVEYTGNSRSTYADAIGWPYTATGRWRGYGSTRNGLGWLAWCYTHDIDQLAAGRLHALAWVDALHASRHHTSGQPLSKRNKALMASAASSFYTWAIREGHAEVNPIVSIDRNKQGINPSQDKSQTRSLSKAEAHAMLKAADNDPVEAVRLRTSAIIAVLLTVGSRVSEGICNATLADMYVQDGRRVLHVILKGGKDHLFPLPPSVCRRIDAYMASRQDVHRLPVRRGEVGNGNTPLFATASGKPITRGEVWQLVRRIASLAGIDHPQSVHPHVGRHTWITEARRQGHQSAEIQAAVGHAYASTTDRYGVHILNLEKSPVYSVAEAFEAGETGADAR